MANIPSSLRYSLLFVFAMGGVVAASAIVRLILMTAGDFLRFQDEMNLYAYESVKCMLTTDCHTGALSKVPSHSWWPHYRSSEVE
jgi:hypothetical protein